MRQPWVEADLTFSVDGSRGTVTGAGQVLTVHLDDPARISVALPGAAQRVGEIADLLAATGVRVQVRGPHGLLAQVGSGVNSTAGGWVTGSRHVAPGGIRALAPVAAVRLRRPAATALLTLLAAWWLRSARRRSR